MLYFDLKMYYSLLGITNIRMKENFSFPSGSDLIKDIIKNK